jgi:DNA-binding NtrC family response regulator
MSPLNVWSEWAQQLPVRDVGLRMVSSPVASSVVDDPECQAALRSVGYVPISAGHTCAVDERRALTHRHVAVLMDTPLDDIGRRWIRDLAVSSPRPHLVVVAPTARAVPMRVHERAPTWGASTPVEDAQSRRARRLREAGRSGQGLLWLAAAVASARRRCEAERHVALLKELWQWARLTGDGTRRELVGDECRVMRVRATSFAHWAQYAAMWADVRAVQGELEAARALLAALAVEADLTGASLPAVVALVNADVALWRGQWADARRWAAKLGPSTAEGALRRAVVSWLQRDRETAGHTSVGGVAAVALEAALADDSGRVRQAVAELDVRNADVWAVAAAAAALVATGDSATAQRVTRARIGTAPPLEAALLRMAADNSVDNRTEVLRDVRRWGAAGLDRWREGRSAMSIWGGVVSLLEEINGADDEHSALVRACRWVRHRTGAPHIVVQSDPDAIVLAADPPDARARRDDVRCGVRHGGATIGWISASAQVRDHEELHGSLQAMASAIAAAVRIRIDAAAFSEQAEGLAGELLGQSPAMVELRRAVARAAPTIFPVLIEGESGAGKELVARAVHRLSPRRDRRLAAINCAAMTDELIDAELFGHSRGAFTGAVGPRAGLFEDADRGTVFLDEVGELSPRAQAKLLRVLQEREVRRVGESQSRAIDVRIVAATNRSLSAAAAAGQYRDDLRYRLSVVRIVVPPLRERVEDIPLLAHAFWHQLVPARPTRAWLSPGALAALCRRPWPGNVRQLQNVIAGLILVAPERGRVTAQQVEAVVAAQDSAEAVGGVTLDQARRALDRQVVAGALARHAGCRAAAARELGVSRQGLSKLMARLALSPARFASSPSFR